MTNSESPLFRFKGDDSAMEQAAERARSTFKYFWREMSWENRRIIPGLELAAVKATFRDPPDLKSEAPDALEAEHMWLMEVEFDGKHIKATLSNNPHSLNSVKAGDRVTIGMEQLCDWMYVISGNVYGGFTVDLMRSRMSKIERMAHDNAWGFDFGEVGVVPLVPPEFFGGSSTKKKGFFSFFGKAKSPPPPDEAKVEETEHPMSVNMRESLEEALKQNPDWLTELNDEGVNFLHQLSLAGSLDGVDVCLKLGANPNMPAQNGMTAYALAKSLGWKKVMERLKQAGAKE